MSFVKPPPFHARIRESEQGVEIEILRRSRWPMRLLTLFGVVWFAAGWLAFVVGAIVLVVALLFPGDVPVNSDPIATVVCLPILIVVMVGYPFLLTRTGWRGFLAAWMKREVLTANQATWRVEEFFGPWHLTHLYATKDVSNAHQYTMGHQPTLRGALNVFLFSPGAIAFRYRRRRVAIARAATEAEARQIIRALRHEPARYHSWQAPGAFHRQPGGFGTIAFDYGAGTYRFGQDLTPAEAQALLRQILDRFPQYGRDDMIPKLSDHTSS